MSWTRNLERRGGFYGDTYWYDYHLKRRMPLVASMIEETVAAIPPCNNQDVLDICAGTGNLSVPVLSAYPTIRQFTMLDASADRLNVAKQKVDKIPSSAIKLYKNVRVDLKDSKPLPGSPYHLIVGSLAFHPIIEQLSYEEYGDTTSKYELLFNKLNASLSHGGHLIFGDHVGEMSLCKHIELMKKVGMVDVDCAWRINEFFVAGGRRCE